ncbi:MULTISPECIES: hypothetical protein [Nostoc]|uniref:Uncharacterized protein n=1 Tax=Nostoc paludosum FACHB-159 TaxID=2692908 RepID=A0ABR8KIJ9_9NOSO|nr:MULTISPECIES: hypothetical protein [Nostoc]MBD2682368.1 hypothetical protein [Nostoc sp. FACHB-857]MBD2738689.1 hypothetical protein [Nostoc paludosum FACHB-159]
MSILTLPVFSSIKILAYSGGMIDTSPEITIKVANQCVKSHTQDVSSINSNVCYKAIGSTPDWIKSHFYSVYNICFIRGDRPLLQLPQSIKAICFHHL